MNKIWTIIKKELRRFFTDKRMLMNLFLPGILIFVIYTLMGTIGKNMFTPNTDYEYKVMVTNYPEEYKSIIETDQYNIKVVSEELSFEEIKENLKNDNLSLYINFDADFVNKVNNGEKPNIGIYYNSTSPESSLIYQYFYSSFTAIGTEINFNFLVNMNPNISYDQATQEDMSAMMITTMLPYLLVVFLCSGCLALTTESIAGEKERGTIYTLLVTPTKRSHIALGKIFALSITSLVSALVSFAGLLCSLPTLMSGAPGGMTLGMYGVGTYFAIFGVILVTVFFFTTILAIISTLAKSVKEANQYASVVMVLVTILGLGSMISMGKVSTNLALYFIPILNSVLCMGSIFALEFNVATFLVTLLSNILYIGLGTFLLARMFNSEKIMKSN